ncbi:DUF1643 domain-containing protein [Pseudanabaena sp. UWO311]|uniref:DUF1643 domain-containing protein n=1 Tax=Pseudanabaena sp. UWO311 TaxID=2487337 RepID=UPI00115961C6|nr:DUF1643 domain-containing protein [Pseudanabaena sp. UWO311]TYQ23220.1 DUF1643 domain-containing protein [Pseudanabaena sp. UWO311]
MRVFSRSHIITSTMRSLLKKAIKSADKVVVAWGNNGKLMQRDRLVLELLSKHDIQPHCLGITKADYPHHPLYIMCSKQLGVYR